MIKVYFTFKIILLAFVIVYVSLIISHELNPDSTFFKGENKKLLTPYSTIKELLITDPYKTETLKKVENTKQKMIDIFSDRATTLTNMTGSTYFEQQIYSYKMDGKIKDMDDIVEEYFGQYNDFRDLILIDAGKNLLYKYGTESFAIRFYDISYEVETHEFDDLFGIIHRIENQLLDYEYEVITIFNYQGIKNKVSSLSLPAYIYIYDEFITNDIFPYSVFEEQLDFIEYDSKIRVGLKFLETFPINFMDYRIAQGGVVYPVRSFLSYSVIILKLLGFIIALFFLFLIDRSIHLFLKKKSVDKAEVRYDKDDKLPKSGNNDSNLEEEKLNWVKSYIRESEDGK